MQRKTLARADVCGLEVSAVGLGCNNFGRRLDARGSAAVIDAAIDAGITFFDTAEAYGNGQSEDHIGRALGRRRPGIQIATKFGLSGRADAERIASALEARLRRLRTDYIDLYQIHRPDTATPIADTLGAMDRLVREGKVRWIGCSSFSADQLHAADQASGERGQARFVTAQNAYSILDCGIEADLLAGLRTGRRGPAALLSARQRHLERQVPARYPPGGRHEAGRRRRRQARPARRCDLRHHRATDTDRSRPGL